MNPIIKKISDMSSKNRYLSKYCGDLVFSVILVLITFAIYCYFQAQNNIHSIRDNWETEKCKPNIIPIAGYIRPPNLEPEKTNFQYGADNYKKCMGGTTFSIVKPITNPFNDIINGIKGLFSNISNLGSIVYDTVNFLSSILSEIMNIFFGIIKMLVKLLRQIMMLIGGFFYKVLLIFYVGVLMFKTFLTSSIAGVHGFIIVLMIFFAIIFAFFTLAGVMVALGSVLMATLAMPAGIAITSYNFPLFVMYGAILLITAALTIIFLVISDNMKNFADDMNNKLKAVAQDSKNFIDEIKRKDLSDNNTDDYITSSHGVYN